MFYIYIYEWKLIWIGKIRRNNLIIIFSNQLLDIVVLMFKNQINKIKVNLNVLIVHLCETNIFLIKPNDLTNFCIFMDG